MSNWKNVNNWHWTEKDCLPWTKKYFTEKIEGLTLQKDELKVIIEKVDDIQGDTVLNQRKGKIITLFDLVIKLKWKGNLSDGTEVEGRVNIPEVAHDTDEDDYVLEITIDNDTKEKSDIRNLIRVQLKEKLIPIFSNFPKDLIHHHSKDVYIPKELLGQPAPPRSHDSPLPTPLSNEDKKVEVINVEELKKSSVKINTTTLKDSIEFVTSASQLYNALTDNTLLSVWTRSDAKFSKNKGDKFSLFGGNIVGEVIELVDNHKIQLLWRSNLWPKEHYSTVTLTLEEQRESVQLNLVQEGVPVGQEEITRNNWSHYYWNPIKSTFGFGAVL